MYKMFFGTKRKIGILICEISIQYTRKEYILL